MTPKPLTNIDRALAHIIHAIEKYDWFWPECDDVTRDDLFFAKEELELYQQDQAARQAAMERVALDLQTLLDAATPNDEWPASYTVDADDVEVLSESLAIMLAALDATEQEAGHE